MKPMMMMNNTSAAGPSLLVGIDPDVDRSGVAVKHGRGPVLELHTLRFFELLAWLQAHQAQIRLVRVEAGWLNAKSNFRSSKYSKAASEAISKAVGANHEAGRKIVEMLQALGIPHELVKPLKKCWRGPDGKISHAEFVRHFGQPHKTSNQEQRDAALLIL